ncbi:hypothetical protein GBA52_007042 [Prunus armeniaca]|nr:hypothetical protein GBA52_007042 [Prunus armeniaca]
MKNGHHLSKTNVPIHSQTPLNVPSINSNPTLYLTQSYQNPNHSRTHFHSTTNNNGCLIFLIFFTSSSVTQAPISVSQEEFVIFHNIDHKLFSRLIFA